MTTATPPAVEPRASLFRQPPAVWAVAFASMVAFMGIGLVGPVLPSISESLNASPTQTSLLFTSYLAVTAACMFFTSWLSSRIGTRNTMLAGLAVIVAGAIWCATSTSIDSLIAARALWGLGNALFLSTALASIIQSSHGSAGGAIILYEAALGLGLAVGPLAGGLLGQSAWSAPFWGTASLMAVGFVVIVAVVRGAGRPGERAHVSAPFTALARPALLIIAIASFFYNAAFFVVLAYAPYPLEMGAVGVGLVMTGFGAGLALTSVAIAPWFTRRFPVLGVAAGALVLFALTQAAACLLVENRVALIVCIVLIGFEIGALNTLLTEAAMEATDLPRPIASSAYSGIRFIGGAVGAPIGTGLAVAGAGMPFLFCAGVALVALLIILFSWKHLHAAERPVHFDSAEEQAAFEAQAVTAGE